MSSMLDIADLAAEQWGLVTTSQAGALGVSPQAIARLTRQGALERMTHGVHRVTGAPPSPLDDLRAAWLALDPSRRSSERLRDEDPIPVAYRSAASIHGLGDLEADRFEFISGMRKQTRRPDIRIHRGHVGSGEWIIVDGLPVTSVLRTVADLAAANLDGGHLASVVRDALTRQQVDDRQLAAALRSYAHHYGVRLGDGEALLARFLQESGVSEPLGRAVELAGATSISRVLQMLGNSRDLQLVSEQLALIQRSIAPAARLSEQIVNNPGMKAVMSELARQQVALADSPAIKAAVDLVRQQAALADSPGMKGVVSELARQQAALADSPAIKAVVDLVRQQAALADSPAVQRLAKQSSEVAKMTQLARSIGDSINLPDLELDKQEKGE